MTNSNFLSKIKTLCIVVAAMSAFGVVVTNVAVADKERILVGDQSVFDKESVKRIMDKVNHYQLKHPHAKYDDNWIRGTYYSGVTACYQKTGDKRYLEQCNALGKELNWKIPTGFRSSHHIWNEAEQCVVFEIYAKRYAAQGEKEKAEAFKRGAMLSLQNVKSWIRPDGSGYIVKNKYPIKSQHGYENYSVYACYNMLAMSMLAQAYQFADDSIQESVAPTDVGGYAIPLLIPFHKIIASSGSVYLEYDTRGDQQYNPTGMIRIHIKGSHPHLGPSDGCASKFSGRDVSIAVGPSWQNADGSWSSLASLRQNPDVEILQETTDEVKLKIAYTNKRGADTVSVAETITIGKHHGITVEDNLSGNIQLLRITYPMLIFNGENKTEIQLDKNKAGFIVGK